MAGEMMWVGENNDLLTPMFFHRKVVYTETQ